MPALARATGFCRQFGKEELRKVEAAVKYPLVAGAN